MTDAATALLAATAAHAAFSAVVTAVAYPALVATEADRWAAVHAAHTRRITPVVAAVYGALLASWAWALATLPVGAGLVVAAVGTVLALGTTAAAAAPTHARLGREGPRPELLRRLLRADVVRTAGAVLALAGALAVAW
ncbi:hypothetical protein AB1207_13845 [Kineococcus endophyticus]|uniref:DUF1772 domain-containing protein n=1 Tax=Kineococcus endophyticus TaxID=1181883 RepID=A0ABV3P875_9ACTN